MVRTAGLALAFAFALLGLLIGAVVIWISLTSRPRRYPTDPFEE